MSIRVAGYGARDNMMIEADKHKRTKREGSNDRYKVDLRVHMSNRRLAASPSQLNEQSRSFAKID